MAFASLTSVLDCGESWRFRPQMQTGVPSSRHESARILALSRLRRFITSLAPRPK